MAHATHTTPEDEELGILREHMLAPEELFLLQYLKNANRKASQKIQEISRWDDFLDE